MNKNYKKIGLIIAVILTLCIITWFLYKSLYFQFSISPSDKIMSDVGPSVTLDFNIEINPSTVQINYDKNIFHEVNISERSIKLSTLNRKTSEESTDIDIVFIETVNGSQKIENKKIKISIKEFDANSVSTQEHKDLIANQDREYKIDPIFTALPKETLDYTIRAEMSADQPIVTITILTSSIDDENSIASKRDGAMNYLKSLKESENIDISKYYIKFKN